MMKTQKVNVIRVTVKIACCALVNVLCLNAALAAQDRLTLQDKDVVLQTTNVVDVIAVQCRDLARLYRDGVKVAECHPDTSGKVVFPGVRLNRGVTLIRVEAGDETDELSWRFGVTEGAPAGTSTRKFENPRVKWFEDARFGLFVHWGIYSIPGKGEWTYAENKYAPGEYEAFAKQFNPTDYDPREWARLAKSAGMKYVVFTTRHHDGFCMFDSHFTDYKITNTPYGKDVLRMLCEAFRAEGIKIGFYHSLPDWTNDGYVDPETPACIQTGKCRPYDATKHAAYRKLVWNHVNQLTTEYGKVDLMFFDYTSKFKNDIDYFARDELMALCRRNQPDIIINDRLAYFKDGAAPDFDYYTPETAVPSAAPVVRGTERTWETCATMNDSWGYRAADKNFKSVETLVSGLVGCVSRNGNLLLNVGPDEKGRIPPESVERLKGLADWYRVNGESVTGCGASALTPPYGCVYTQKGNTLYLHVNVVPMGDLILPGLLGKIGRMTLLRTGEVVSPVSFWGFETLRPDDCRIRATGLRVGDVIKIEAPMAEERRIAVADFRDRMEGAWIGQSIGVAYGWPTEFRWCGALVPEEKMPKWKAGMINETFSQDDLYVEMTFIDVLDRMGVGVSSRAAGIEFANSRYRLWCANMNARNNIRNGIAAPASSHPKFHGTTDDIDYQIEADFSGILAPGLPQAAVDLGETFGRIMNYGDGLYAGQFVGAMYANAYFETDRVKVVQKALKVIPAESRYARMVRDMLAWYRADPRDWRSAWTNAVDRYWEKDTCKHVSTADINVRVNGAMALLGLLWGDGDMDRTMYISTAGGYDSDCNPSSACGVLGAMLGARRLGKYVEGLDRTKRWEFTDYDYGRLLEVCERLSRQLVVKYGGRIERNDSGAETFVVPMSEVRPSEFFDSAAPGPEPTNDRLTDAERVKILYGPCKEGEQSPARGAIP